MQNHFKTLTTIMALALVVTLVGTLSIASPQAMEANPTPAPAMPSITKGSVIETMDSGGYTYLCIESNGQKRWAAIPKTEVKVGQQVELSPGTEMGTYTSKTLGRTFDSIYFCGGLANAPSKLPHPAPEVVKPATVSMPPDHGMPSASKPGGEDVPAAMTISGKIVETFDGGGYTYVSVEQDGKKTWVASPPIKVTVGQSVTFVSGFVMKNFTSKALNRSFDSIVFSSGLAAPPTVPAAESTGK